MGPCVLMGDYWLGVGLHKITVYISKQTKIIQRIRCYKTERILQKHFHVCVLMQTFFTV